MRRAPKIPSRAVPDAGLTKERAVVLARQMFGARKIDDYLVSEGTSGVIIISSPDDRKGYSFFAPNGTRASADYVKNAQAVARAYQIVDREITVETDLRERVVGIKWCKRGKTYG